MITLRTLHRASLLASTSLSVLGVVGGSWLLLGGGCVLILWMLATSGQLFVAPRPRPWVWGVNVITVVALVMLVSRLPTLHIDAVLLVVMLGMGHRFGLRVGQRDDFLIVGAGAVLLAAATTITPGPLFGLILVLYVPSALWTLLSSQILEGVESRTMSDGRPLADPPTRRRALEERRVPPRLLRVGLSGLALTLVGFAVVSMLPRYNFGRFLAAGYFMPLPGASETMAMSLRGAGDLEDDARVLRVEPGGGPLEGLYARLYALDLFDGRRWWQSPSGLRPATSSLVPPRDLDHESTARVTFERLRGEQLHPVAVLGFSGPSPLVAGPLSETGSGTLVYLGSWTKNALVYGVRLDRRVQALSLEDRERFLAVPSATDPRVGELARRLTEGLPSDKARLHALLGHFEGGFQYSRAAIPGTSPDPVVRFLFEARQGHCELYAGSLTLLLRLSGVPARLATGYYGGRWNSLGGYLEVTARDAHAWTEVFLEGEGWVWADATPPDLRASERARPSSWLADLRDLVEKVWFDNVLDFDESKRRALVAGVRAELAELWRRWVADVPGRVDDLARSNDEEVSLRPASIPRALLAFILLALGLGSGALVFGVRRGRDVRRVGLRLRRSLEGALRRHEGRQEGPRDARKDGPAVAVFSQPLEALALRIGGPHRAEALRVVRAYEALRFGAPSVTPDLADLRRLVRSLERSLRSRRAPPS